MDNLDTLDIADKLAGEGFSRQQSRALSLLVNEGIKMSFRAVASREDIARLQEDITRLRTSTDEKIGRLASREDLFVLRADLERSAREQTRWMVTVAFTAAGLIMAALGAAVAVLKVH